MPSTASPPSGSRQKADRHPSSSPRSRRPFAPCSRSASRSRSTTRRTTSRCSIASAAATTWHRSVIPGRSSTRWCSTRPSTATARASGRSRRPPSATASPWTTPTTRGRMRSPRGGSRRLSRAPIRPNSASRHPDLHRRQTVWYAEQAARFQDYIRRAKGDQDYVASTAWPVRMPDNESYRDTQPIPPLPPRPSGHVPVLDFSKPIALQLAPPPSMPSRPAIATPPTGFGPAGYRQTTGPIPPARASARRTRGAGSSSTS